jgi:hypothetical protein
MQTKKRSNIATRTTPFYWISKAILRKHRPSWRALLAYNALAYYAEGSTGSCEHFSLKTLASLVGISKDTLLRGLDELEKKGLIVRHRRSKQTTKGRPGSGGKGGSRMPLPTLYELTDQTGDSGEPI